MSLNLAAQPNSANLTDATKPSITVLRPTDFPGVELELVSHLPPATIPKLATSGTEFMVVREGSAEVRYLGQHYSYRQARNIFVRHSLEDAISGRTLTRSSYYALRLSGETERHLASTLGLAKLPVVTDPYAPESERPALLHLTAAAVAAFVKPHTHLERELRLLRLLRFNLNGVSDEEQRREHRAVKTVKDYIQAYPERQLSFAMLTELTGLNAAYAVQVFKQATGVTPSAYARGVRVERAKGLLVDDDAADVAQRLGFADQSHFIRVFKRYVYVTPGQFQRDNR